MSSSNSPLSDLIGFLRGSGFSRERFLQAGFSDKRSSSRKYSATRKSVVNRQPMNYGCEVAADLAFIMGWELGVRSPVNSKLVVGCEFTASCARVAVRAGNGAADRFVSQ